MKRISKYILLAIGIGFLVLSWVLHQSHSKLVSNENQFIQLQQVIWERSVRLEKITKEFSSNPCGGFDAYQHYPEAWKRAAEEDEIALFKIDKENLLYWSDNALPVGIEALRKEPVDKLWKLKNGWYLAHRIVGEPCTVVGLALIKREFSYSNKYLNNYFKDAADVAAGSALSRDSLANGYALKNNRGSTIAYFSPAEDEIAGDSKNQELPALVLFLTGIVILLRFIHQKLIDTAKPLRNTALFWVLLLVLRGMMLLVKSPEILYTNELFGPADYASSNWLPTLGDLLLHSLILFYGSLVFYRFAAQFFNSIHIHTLVIGLTISIGLAILCSDLIRSLVIDSSIGFEINNISARSSATYIAYLIIALLLASAFVGFAALPPIKSLKNQIIVATSFLLSIWLGLKNSDEILIALAPVLIFLISRISKSSVRRDYGQIILVLVLLAATGTLILLHYTGKRELEKRHLLAAGIAAERDPIAERIFLEAEQKIATDTLLKSYLRPGTIITGQVRDLAQLYFNGYWEKYKINVQVYAADECPLTSLYTNGGRDPAVFENLIDSIGIPTQSDNFYFLDNNSGRISYLARLDVRESMPDTSNLARLYIEFNSRYTPEEIGYPELLLDRKVKTNTDLSRYSYARYNDGKLVSHFGQFPYRLIDHAFQQVKADSQLLFKSDNFSHLVARSGPNTLVVLSLPEPGLLQMLTPFSYLLLLFSLLAVILFTLNRRLTFQGISFKRKIQGAIILILFIALLLIGGGTIFYIISNNAQKNQRSISEKVHSILVEIELMFNRQEFLDPAKSDEIAYALSRQANVFFSDINLFYPSGFLYASSRTKLYDEGLISRKINPEAYYHLSVENTSEYLHKERIGQLEYISAYVPLRNPDNKVIGYINLPYFARQSELQREIASFIVAIVNIYVLLLILVLIAAIFLSNSVTEPLRILQERIGSVRLGSKNEAIRWKSRDEIGALIDEYNRMLGELAESAEKLAKSERESAWREMAKQVAHEIKNPLTPMKLNTQMLKRAWDDKAPGFEDRLNRYAQNLIEQIDTLSHIATEFGNFAQMPKMQKERVNMREILEQAAEFHQSQECQIRLDIEHDGNYEVFTDKEQMMRVFNNLIKNAEQAIPAERDALINLRLRAGDSRIIIEVSDNGSGIPDALKDRIFNPNFTTKSTGMGLGLALVKNIIESSDGSIRFESAIDAGTTFIIDLPLAK